MVVDKVKDHGISDQKQGIFRWKTLAMCKFPCMLYSFWKQCQIKRHLEMFKEREKEDNRKLVFKMSQTLLKMWWKLWLLCPQKLWLALPAAATARKVRTHNSHLWNKVTTPRFRAVAFEFLSFLCFYCDQQKKNVYTATKFVHQYT